MGWRSCVGLVLASLVLWAEAGAAVAGRIGLAPDDDVPPWRVVGALLLCLALAGAGAFILRRRLGGGIATISSRVRRVRLVETVRLSHQTDVCLLKVDDEDFLVAASASGTVLLARGLKGEGTPAP
jgi:hypothetical protein